MKITRKLLKRIIQESLGSKSYSPEIEDRFEAYQDSLEDKFEQASQNEPTGQATMMRDFEQMLVAQNPHAAEVFMMAIHDYPQYVGQFFDFSRGRIQLKEIHWNGITLYRLQEIIDIARSYGESHPIFGPVIKNENALKEVESYLRQGGVDFNELYIETGLPDYERLDFYDAAKAVAKRAAEEVANDFHVRHLNPEHVYVAAYHAIVKELEDMYYAFGHD